MTIGNGIRRVSVDYKQQQGAATNNLLGAGQRNERLESNPQSVLGALGRGQNEAPGCSAYYHVHSLC